ncbi:MAG: Bll2902 protein [uncultured Sphingosinicella sp.]|uniref:Bll2902 protein n=1 Tax=uncultured Sphingosinicella sp. TaxID=478748 RepID=A0A6J4UA00_9SPHN|nr:OsmC family protein [uncultured Sphingosinicella sp.]CAA9542666.1 MAG: Bll2902 protein [uncultured Sphingosinicella sp.]
MAEEEQAGVVARLTGVGQFQTRIEVRNSSILADEPVEVGGLGTGPTPYELLSSALAACTAMTLRLYAERKGWTLPVFEVEVAHSREGNPPRDLFTRRIAYQGELSAEWRAKMIEIADKCPVHRTLMRGFEIVTSAGRVESAERPAGEPPSQHERDMEEACLD